MEDTELWNIETPAAWIGDDLVDVPAWIDPDITPATIMAIEQGGCESGAYMPAVTYHDASKTMLEYGDAVLTFLEDRCESGLPPLPESPSWSGIAVHFLSYAVDLWAGDAAQILRDHDDDDDDDDPNSGLPEFCEPAMIRIHAETHTDHGVPDSVRDHVRALFSHRTEFFAETVTIPDGLPSVSCGLHLDVPDSECVHDSRNDRPYPSRLCDRPRRMVREVTIVAGPDPDGASGLVLFTVYGGPNAPQEPDDPRLPAARVEESRAFWSHAALSRE